MKTVALAVLGVVLTGCASSPGATFEGYHIDTALTQWGAPAQTARLSDGRSVYTWNHQRLRNLTCTYSLIADAEGVVTASSQSASPLC